MKRGDLLRELSNAGCSLKRNGGRHDIWYNPSNGKSAPVPRHSEIPNTLCVLIKKQLGVSV
ncbi:MAG: type II toxin-antitoxin system HicA family toxin [Ignavibacteria bacterium]|nr:type II toxin-antitoxin system HicA family toxin [Ignavibacteria bacterium]